MGEPFTYIEPESTRHRFMGVKFIRETKKRLLKPEITYYFSVDELETLPNVGETIEIKSIKKLIQDWENPYKFTSNPIEGNPYRNLAKVVRIVDNVDVADFHYPLYGIGANGEWASIINYEVRGIQ